MKNNDMHMVIYLSALIRCVIALHDLVLNKIAYNEEVGDGLGDVIVKAKKAEKDDSGEEKKEEEDAKASKEKK